MIKPCFLITLHVFGPEMVSQLIPEVYEGIKAWDTSSWFFGRKLSIATAIALSNWYQESILCGNFRPSKQFRGWLNNSTCPHSPHRQQALQLFRESELPNLLYLGIITVAYFYNLSLNKCLQWVLFFYLNLIKFITDKNIRLRL